MGVIQSAVNQAIGAAGETIRDVKLLEKTQEIAEGKNEVPQNVLYTDDQKQQMRDKQIEQEEKAKLAAKIREKIMREREQRYTFDRQSTIQRLRNLKEDKEREALRKSILGGGLNG